MGVRVPPGAYGAMAEWLKARVCKTFGEIPRQFESGSHLFIGDYIMDTKQVKKVIATTLVIVVMIFFGVIMFIGDTEPEVLQGGDIQNSIDTGQYK